MKLTSIVFALQDIFVSICQVDDSLYFMCNIEDFKFLADTIQHVPLPLKTRYVFCCAPISRKQPFVCSLFLKVTSQFLHVCSLVSHFSLSQFARQFSRGEPLTFEWVTAQLGWPFNIPETIAELQHLENVFDVFDLYLWLTYRFPDMFPDTERMRNAQRDLDKIIFEGVKKISRLLDQQQATGKMFIAMKVFQSFVCQFMFLCKSKIKMDRLYFRGCARTANRKWFLPDFYVFLKKYKLVLFL